MKKSSLITLPALGIAAMTANAQQAPNGYNIVFVFADQLRADVLGYNGDTKAITPNIDRLASESINFTNCVTNYPVSAAYRASLLTGKYTSSTGMIINEINMNPNHRTIAHVLNDAGYKNAYIGKVHLNDGYRRPYLKGPERLGFDDFWSCYTFNHHSFDAFYSDENDKFVDIKGQYDSDVFTQMAEDYMARKVEAGENFNLVLSWNPTHDPWARYNVLDRCYEKFKEVQFDLPENFKEEIDQHMDRFPGEFIEKGTKWKESWIRGGGYQETMRCYYAMVNSIDEQVGRIMDCLDRLGIADNTILVFTSDHGEQFSSQGRMYKLIFYEESAHMPLLVRYPGCKGGTVCDACIGTPDLAPTLIGAVGHHDMIPAEMEGDDLSFLLRGEKGKEPEFTLLQGMGHTHLWKDGFEWRAVRDKRYTYAKYLVDGEELLFDRLKDPYEKVNLASDKKYRRVMKLMRKRMAAKMEEIGDEFHTCTWYRDHWTYKGFSIKAAAHGEFGPLPPLEPNRTR